MPPFTLNQAAKEAGKSKSTLLDAIRAGRLTAPKDDKGRYQIDPAELFRVYPPTSPEPDEKTGTDLAIPDRTDEETAMLRQKLEFLTHAIERIECERDEWRDQCKRMTLLLADRSEPKAKTGGLWKKLFGG